MTRQLDTRFWWISDVIVTDHIETTSNLNPSLLSLTLSPSVALDAHNLPWQVEVKLLTRVSSVANTEAYNTTVASYETSRNEADFEYVVDKELENTELVNTLSA